MDEKEYIDVTDIGFEGRKSNKGKHSKEVFKYILKGTPFEKYASDIFEKLLSIKYGKAVLSEEERMRYRKELYQKQKNIAESLLLCKENEELRICAGSKQSRLPENVKEIMEKELEKDYREAQLNYEPMTFEAGKFLLELGEDYRVRWFINDYWEQYADELGLTAEEKAGGYNYDDITDDMVEMFIDGKEMSVEITKEQIKGKLSIINREIMNSTQIRKGAPKKNLKLHSAISVFRDTKQYIPCNKTYRTIYKCLDFLEMIDEGQKELWKTSSTPNPEVSWMKQLCKEAAKYQAEIFPF